MKVPKGGIILDKRGQWWLLLQVAQPGGQPGLRASLSPTSNHSVCLPWPLTFGKEKNILDLHQEGVMLTDFSQQLGWGEMDLFWLEALSRWLLGDGSVMGPKVH